MTKAISHQQFKNLCVNIKINIATIQIISILIIRAFFPTVKERIMKQKSNWPLINTDISCLTRFYSVVIKKFFFKLIFLVNKMHKKINTQFKKIFHSVNV